MNRWVLLLFVLTVGLKAENNSEYGRVWNVNQALGEITILPPAPGMFRRGQKIYFFDSNGQTQKGFGIITADYHTKAIVGKISGIDKIVRGNLASLNGRPGKSIAATVVGNKKILDYNSLATSGREWIVQIQYGKGCGEDERIQLRKIIAGNTFGYRMKGDSFYSAGELKDVKKINFHWDGKKYAAESIEFAAEKSEAEEILLSEFIKKIPPLHCRGKKQDVVFKPVKGMQITDFSPDSVTVDVAKKKMKNLLKGSDGIYSIAIYSNGRFLQESEISPEDLRNTEKNFEMKIPGYYFSPGENHIQCRFYLQTKKGSAADEISEESICEKTIEVRSDAL